MKKSIVLFIALLTLYSFSQTAKPTQLLNIAAKQRMIVQKLCKDKIYHSLGIKNEETLKSINNYILIFETNLKVLNMNLAATNVKTKIEKVGLLWNAYKTNLQDETDVKNSASAIYYSNNEIFNSCEALLSDVYAYLATLPKDSEEKFNQEDLNQLGSGARKLRMLSQRVCFYYAYYFNDIDKVVASTELQRASDTIDLILSTLAINENNTPQSEVMISEMLNDWQSIKKPESKPLSTSLQSKPVDLITMYDSMNKFYEKADKLAAYSSYLLK